MIIDLLNSHSASSISQDELSLSISVSEVTDPSIITSDRSIHINEDASVAGQLEVTDNDGLTSIDLTIGPTANPWSIKVDFKTGEWTYTPDEYHGNDKFTITDDSPRKRYDRYQY